MVGAVIVLACCLATVLGELEGVYTNHFVAEIDGGAQEALRLAKRYSLRLMNTDIYPDMYHFVNGRQPHYNMRPEWRITRGLQGHHKVKFAEQQVLRPRYFRTFETKNSVSSDKEVYFNDPLYPKLWHLHGRGFYTGKKTVHLNVEPVWKQGLTGRGVVLFVLDDGLQRKNKEIAPNFESVDDWDVSDMKHPLPSASPRGAEDNHGTLCAGAMAAAANNSVCGVGVAFGAKVGGIRVLGKKPLTTDLQEALALTLWLGTADIASASWGPKDNGRTVQAPKRLATKALWKATTKGRHGKGAILVWAAGNGGLFHDNANLDGYASSIHTITIGALLHNGDSCIYTEPGAVVLASVAVSGYLLGMKGVSVVGPNLDGTCKLNFQGTSAAAPLAGGVIALLLEANPNVTWRDVQHLIVITSQKTGSSDAWHRNGAGLQFSPKHGFGAIDAELLVNAGRNWKNLPPQRTQVYKILDKSPLDLVPGTNSSVRVHVPQGNITRLEHVIADLSISHHERGLLEVFLSSPSGTVSQLLTRRPKDTSGDGFRSWHFMSVHFWGEQPSGEWTLTVRNGDPRRHGSLTKAVLMLYGH